MISRRIAAAVLFLTLSATSCGEATGPSGSSTPTAQTTQTITEVDYEPYGTVESLSKVSDVVAIGTIGALAGKGLDTGGNDAKGAGVPMLYYEFSVESVISGTNVPSRIVIAWLDGEALGITDQGTFSAGQKLILFLDRVSGSSAAAPQGAAGPRFVVLSGDNGVLDVNGASAVARSNHLTRLDHSSPGSSVALATRVEDIERAVMKAKS